VSGLVEGLLGLASPWGYLVVALLAGLEAAAFVGLVIPGETAMLLGGVLAFTGRASVVVMMVCAAVGAVVGDALGYELGRRFGGPLRRSPRPVGGCAPAPGSLGWSAATPGSCSSSPAGSTPRECWAWR
jgi:CDP-diglyceride synthetase